ncbi:hypothetical protein DL96DRAFT_1613852 [Flagelloscypha sp. PMI_526]|nr:hypothetical protein DL96DRAFT_1613852 [Flagelloscypha sp. PMI_526]
MLKLLMLLSAILTSKSAISHPSSLTMRNFVTPLVKFSQPKFLYSLLSEEFLWSYYPKYFCYVACKGLTSISTRARGGRSTRLFLCSVQYAIFGEPLSSRSLLFGIQSPFHRVVSQKIFCRMNGDYTSSKWLLNGHVLYPFISQ